MKAQIIQIKVTPRSKASELFLLEDQTWVAKLKSPPVDGKANKELVQLVAARFKCAKSAISIKAGAGGRHKLVEIKQ